MIYQNDFDIKKGLNFLIPRYMGYKYIAAEGIAWTSR